MEFNSGFKVLNVLDEMEFVIEAAATHSKRCVLNDLIRHCLCDL